jgi:hypothetical protein
MKNLTLTVKNTTALKEYFSKFDKVGETILSTIYSDKIVTKSFSADRSLIKISTLDLSEVFEEPQINIKDPIFLCLYEKNKRINKYLSKFRNGASFKINYDIIKSNKLVNLVKGAYEFENLMVVDSLNFEDKVLKLKLKASNIEMVATVFKLTDEMVEKMTSDKKPNSICSTTEITSETLSSLSSLIADIPNSDSKNAKGIEVINDEESKSLTFSVKNYFDIKLDSVVGCSQKKSISSDFINVLDNENYTLKIIISNLGDTPKPVAIWQSNETQTQCIVSFMKGDAVSEEEVISSNDDDDDFDAE